ncbi:MAG TPA: VWA domain-containing protein [Vicinamibacterales bacterium]
MNDSLSVVMLSRQAAAACMIGGLALSATGPLAARQAAPPLGPSVFRAGVEHVAVDVVVTDAQDKPISDLAAKDFEIREDDHPQQLLDFSHVSVPVNDRSVDLHAVPAPSPDVASNPVPALSSRAFVLLIDDGAIFAGDAVKLKRIMTAFLQAVSPADRVAIVFVRRSDLAQDFTSDPGQLARAVNNIDAAVGWSPDAQATRLVLDHAVTMLAGAPETRRAVVYLSSGFEIIPSPTTDVTPTKGRVDPNQVTFVGLQELFDHAKIADVPIYAVDPHGLVAPALNLAARLDAQTPENRAAVDVRNRNRQDFMRTLPDNTQGLAFVNTSDFTEAVRLIMTDNGNYYVLGYSPSPYEADGKFHSIDVRVVTRPGLRVRARQGYVASARPPASDLSARLLAALSEPEPRSDLNLRVFAAPVAGAPNGATALITLDVSYPAMAGEEPRADDDLHVAFIAADADGHALKSEPQTFHVALATMRHGPMDLTLDDSLDLPKGRWTLIVGVASQMLGAVGTLHLPMDVPALSGSNFESTPLILGLASGAGAASAVVAHVESITQLVPFQPTTNRTFTSGQQLRVFSRVFAAKPASVKTELRLKRGKSVLRTVPLRLRPTPSVTGSEDCEATLDLKDLLAGDYILEFTTRASGHQPVSQELGFRIQ